MDMNQYLSMFIDESREHLQAMNDNLLSLEANPDDVSIVNNIFRSAHTLKGMSATMGYEDIASLTHEMENVLDQVRNHKLKMDPFIFDCVFKSLDSLESMVDDIIQGGSGKAEVQEIVSSLKSIISPGYSGGSKPASSVPAGKPANAANAADALDEFQLSILAQSQEAGLFTYRIETIIQEQCILKAARAFMVFQALEQNGEIVKSTPSVQEIEQERFEQSFVVYFISPKEQEALHEEIAAISEIERVDIQLLDSQALERTAPAATASAADTADKTNAAPAKAEQGKPAAQAAPVAARTIRVDIDRLDTLMNLFSELLIDRVRLEQLASEIKRSDLTETVEHMTRVSSDLQNIVLKLRMVPVENVFNRFPRMVRDVAKSLDKKVDLIITGADTELDRTVIDEIGDPLVHLLRNAVDHGLESTQDRISIGKPETGTIHLRAYHSGNLVFIEVEDNGKGINRDVILKKAIQNGIVSQENASKMTDEEVYMLLFASGFSTAEKLSDLSGRGVGLDVVKTKIEQLGGTIRVESKLGQGSKFSIQLPMTLSIISAMLIRLGQEKYAIPLSSIVETMVLPKDKIRHVHGSLMADYRSTVIPLVNLASLFEVPGTSEQLSNEPHIVVVRKGDKTAAFIVDEFIGQQEIVLKSLGKYLNQLFAVSGATILGDGQVALIVDTNALIV